MENKTFGTLFSSLIFEKNINQVKLADYLGLTKSAITACDLYVATKDIEFVSRHLRHHSLDMTKVYLRSLGVLTDKTNLANAPEL